MPDNLPLIQDDVDRVDDSVNAHCFDAHFFPLVLGVSLVYTYIFGQHRNCKGDFGKIF
jgi:hypothetical protein